MDAWEKNWVPIERARTVRYQPAADHADGDSDDGEAPRAHPAEAPGVATAVPGATLCVPAMPVNYEPPGYAYQPHRDKMFQAPFGHLELVTRQLGPAELRSNPEATKKLSEAWGKLAAMNTWDEKELC